MTRNFWTRLYGWMASVSSFAQNIGRPFTSGISRAKDASRLRVRSWMLGIPLFAVVVTVAPVEVIAVPGYVVIWFGCLFGSWFLLRD